MSALRKPVVVQHSFGDPGSGGPIVALERVLASGMSENYTFVRMHQDRATGGINLSLIRRWVSLLRTTRPDLVHVQGLGNEGFQAVLAARLAGCPNILVSIHGTVRDLTNPPHPLRRWVVAKALEPVTLCMATDIVAVCRAMEERSLLDPVRRKVRPFVTNGVKPGPRVPIEMRESLRAELGLDPDDVALIVVGRLSVEKGHIDLAQALARLDADVLAKAVLVLVGDGPDRESILAAYADVPQLVVRALGRRHDVDRLLQAADIFVFPTLHENLSIALLEAMAAGLPVVATAVGGNIEVLVQGGGILVQPGDREGLVSAITLLMRSESRRAELGAEAWKVVATGYTLEHMTSAWEERYRLILARGRRK
jgi:glycosyltransferase involved in cell wall biosynthesis